MLCLQDTSLKVIHRQQANNLAKFYLNCRLLHTSAKFEAADIAKLASILLEIVLQVCLNPVFTLHPSVLIALQYCNIDPALSHRVPYTRD